VQLIKHIFIINITFNIIKQYAGWGPQKCATRKMLRTTALKDACHLGRQMSHLFVEKKLGSFFKPALLRSKRRKNSESSTD
jgi:hypothetical protein